MALCWLELRALRCPGWQGPSKAGDRGGRELSLSICPSLLVSREGVRVQARPVGGRGSGHRGSPVAGSDRDCVAGPPLTLRIEPGATALPLLQWGRAREVPATKSHCTRGCRQDKEGDFHGRDGACVLEGRDGTK